MASANDMPTASGLERALECPASLALPHVHESGPDARRGTVIHTFIRSVAVGVPRADALALVPQGHRATCEGIDFTRIVGDLSGVEAEVAYALDVETSSARVLGRNLGRNYPATSPAEVCGTNDLQGERAYDHTPVVIDVKTGDEVTSCDENPQVMFHARARQLITDAPQVEGRLLYIGRTGRVRPDAYTFTRFQLDTFEDRLAALRERATAARERYAATHEVTVSTGPWCAHCPAMVVCPRYTALARTMIADATSIKDRLESMTPDELGTAVVRAQEAKKLVEHVLTGLKAIAERGDIPLPSGKVYGPIEFDRDDFKQGLALQLLREKGATQEEIDACYVESRITQIRVVDGGKKRALAGRRLLKVLT